MIFLTSGLLVAYLDPRHTYSAVLFLLASGYALFFSKGNMLLQLRNLYIDDERLIVAGSFSVKPKMEIPFANIIAVELIPLAQQIVGKLWYIDDDSGEKRFVYYWPNEREATPHSSRLYFLCAASEIARRNERNA